MTSESCYSRPRTRMCVVGASVKAHRKNRRVEIRIVLPQAAILRGIHLPDRQCRNTVVESISIGEDEQLSYGDLPANILSAETDTPLFSGVRMRAGAALMIRLRRLPLGPALRLTIRRPRVLTPPRVALAEVRLGAGRRQPMVASISCIMEDH